MVTGGAQDFAAPEIKQFSESFESLFQPVVHPTLSQGAVDDDRRSRSAPVGEGDQERPVKVVVEALQFGVGDAYRKRKINDKTEVDHVGSLENLPANPVSTAKNLAQLILVEPDSLAGLADIDDHLAFVIVIAALHRVAAGRAVVA